MRAGQTVILGTLVLLAVAAPRASASRGPDFGLDENGWDATDIVVVTEGETIDGKVKVLETWAGSIAVGQELEFPELARFAPERERTVTWTGAEYDCPAIVVSGSRMVLFLFRERAALEAVDSWGHHSTSTAWIEGGQAYTRSYDMFGATLGEHGTEEAMRTRVLELRKLKEARREALDLKDPAQRARALGPFMHEWVARQGTLDGLVRCGPHALPVLCELLDDPSRTGYELYELLAAGYEAAGAEGVNVLIGFLGTVATRLERSSDPAVEWSRAHDPVEGREARSRSRRSSVLMVVLTLAEAPDPRGRRVLERLQRVAVLHADRGLLEACDEALAACSRAPGARPARHPQRLSQVPLKERRDP